MIEIREIRRQDYKKAQQFAIQGMHFDWYMDSKVILDLYARYFWDMELNSATKAYGAYVGDAFVGVLLADMKGESQRSSIADGGKPMLNSSTGYSAVWRELASGLTMKRTEKCIKPSVKATFRMEKSFFLPPPRTARSKALVRPCCLHLKPKNRENWFTFTRMMAAPINSMSTEDLQGLENGRSCWIWKKRKFH